MQSPGQMLSTMVLLSLDTHSNPVTQHDLGTTWTHNVQLMLHSES